MQWAKNVFEKVTFKSINDENSLAMESPKERACQAERTMIQE